MAKRFTDTAKWKDDFRKGLPGAYKLLWDYIHDDCDHAGIWLVEWDIARIRIGTDMVINPSEALQFFGDRILVIEGGKRWVIVDFIHFQYKSMNAKNNTHQSIVKLLNKYDLCYNAGRVEQGLANSSARSIPNPTPRGIYIHTNKTVDSNTLNTDDINENILPLAQGFANPSNGEIKMPFDGDDFKSKWGVWKAYKWEQHQWRYGYQQELHALEQLWRLADGKKDVAIELISNSISKGWKNIGNYSNDAGSGNTNGTRQAAGNASNVHKGGATLNDLEQLKRGRKETGDERTEFTPVEVVK